MEPKQLDIWAALLSSDIKLEILQLLHTHPKLTSGSEEIAKQIGRTKEEIQPELNSLLAIGVVKKADNYGSFCLDEDKDREIQDQIFRYLLKGDTWTTRSYCETFC
jgi:hypothetical protein